jgi:hypothetical protein
MTQLHDYESTLLGDAVIRTIDEAENNTLEWRRWDDELVEDVGRKLTDLVKILAVSLIGLLVLALLWL